MLIDFSGIVYDVPTEEKGEEYKQCITIYSDLEHLLGLKSS